MTMLGSRTESKGNPASVSLALEGHDKVEVTQQTLAWIIKTFMQYQVNE